MGKKKVLHGWVGRSGNHNLVTIFFGHQSARILRPNTGDTPKGGRRCWKATSSPNFCLGQENHAHQAGSLVPLQEFQGYLCRLRSRLQCHYRSKRHWQIKFVGCNMLCFNFALEGKMYRYDLTTKLLRVNEASSLLLTGEETGQVSIGTHWLEEITFLSFRQQGKESVKVHRRRVPPDGEDQHQCCTKLLSCYIRSKWQEQNKETNTRIPERYRVVHITS